VLQRVSIYFAKLLTHYYVTIFIFINFVTYNLQKIKYYIVSLDFYDFILNLIKQIKTKTSLGFLKSANL